MAYQSLVGMKFGQWTVIGDPKRVTSDRDHYWDCVCSCGTYRQVRGSSLKKGKSKSCGCLKKKILSETHSSDLLGQRFGKLVVIEEMPHQNGSAMWKCQCDCGNTCTMSTRALKREGIHSCGCYSKEFITNLNKKNLVGEKFGKLTVLEETQNRSNGCIIWKCQCECGNIVYVPTNALTTGNTSSCGCINYSIGEKNIENILRENNLQYKGQYSEKSLQLKRFDFAIFENNKLTRLIEFDGQQHYNDTSGIWNSSESLQDIQKRDQQKNQWAKEHIISLVRIPYWERDNITLDLILGDKYLVQ